MLSAGAALLGSPSVVGVDIDADALAVALENCDQFEGGLPVDFVRADVGDIADDETDAAGSSGSGGGGGGGWGRLTCDTVIMNPPFGTRAKGADVAFLRAATRLVRARGGAVYSLHKSSTRAHLLKVALRELGCSEAEVIAELRYDLPATYRFHKERSKDIEVDLWRFVVPAGAKAAAPAAAAGSAAGRKDGRGRAAAAVAKAQRRRRKEEEEEEAEEESEESEEHEEEEEDG